MATRELVVLSSSPPHVSDSDVLVTPPSLQGRSLPLTSSPDLPSPSALFTRRPVGLKSGSRAARIPQGAPMGFASTAALLKEHQLSLGNDIEDEDSRQVEDQRTDDVPKAPPTRKSKRPTKRAQTIPKPANTDDAEAKKPRKRRTKAELAAIRDAVERDAAQPAASRAARDDAPAEKPKKRARKTETTIPVAIEAVVGQVPAIDSASRETGEDAVTEKRRKRKAKPDLNNVALVNEVSSRRTTDIALETGATKKPTKRKTKADGKNSTAIQAEGPLALDQAMSRRLSWTPPNDTMSSPHGTNPSRPIELLESPREEAVSPSVRHGSFSALVNNFGYNNAGSADLTAPRTNLGEAFTKRRKIELNHNPVPSAALSTTEPRAASPEKKPKVPQKKPRTITELATAAYRPTAPAAPPVIDPKVSAFFAPQDHTKSSTNPGTESAKPEKPKRAPRQKASSKKADSKPKRTTARSKKAVKLAAEKLLSPEAALLRMNAQDVLFGTSSQLAREESPTFIRDLQQALRDSEAIETQSANNIESLRLRTVAAGPGLSLVGKGKGLWAAAARDHEDGMLEVEPEVGPGADELDAGMAADEVMMRDASEEQREMPSHTQDQTAATFIDITKLSDGSRPDYSFNYELPQPTPSTTNHSEDREKGVSLKVTAVVDDLPVMDSFEDYPSAQPAPPSSDYIDIDEIEDQIQVPKPSSNYGAHTSSVPLAHEPPSRVSGALPRRIALQTLPVSPNVPPHKKSTPEIISGLRTKPTLVSKSASDAEQTASDSVTFKRRPGRPRKDGSTATSPAKSVKKATRAKSGVKKATATKSDKGLATPKKKKALDNKGWVHIDEIEDSEDVASPSPPRRRNIPTVSPPLMLRLSQEQAAKDNIPPSDPLLAVVAATAPAPGDSKFAAKTAKRRKNRTDIPPESLVTLFAQITAQIKATPPSTDPARPSWHEKILLYDPIVVEDLASWLNEEGLKVAVAVPVPKAKAKKGRKRKGTEVEMDPNEVDGGAEEIVEAEVRMEMTELSAGVVQRWCEENSVCWRV